MADERYLRVTEILHPFSGLGSIDKDVLENAANRGTKVHKICESIVEGLGEWGVDDETRGYVESFKKWWGTGHRIIAMEKRFYCHDLKISGQIDLIIESDIGANLIVDLKTPLKPSKTWALQGTAYAYMARKSGFDIDGIRFLKLDKFGDDPKMYAYEEDFDLFKKTYDVFNYFFRKKTSGTPYHPEV